jgi:hypothetical protein
LFVFPPGWRVGITIMNWSKTEKKKKRNGLTLNPLDFQSLDSTPELILYALRVHTISITRKYVNIIVVYILYNMLFRNW